MNKTKHIGKFLSAQEKRWPNKVWTNKDEYKNVFAAACLRPLV